MQTKEGLVFNRFHGLVLDIYSQNPMLFFTEL